MQKSHSHLLPNTSQLDQRVDETRLAHGHTQKFHNQTKRLSPNNRRQRPVKFEQSLRQYERPSRKLFNQGECQLSQTENYQLNEKLFLVDTEKRIKTFEQGWLERSRLIYQKLEEEKQNIHPILCSITGQFKKMAKGSQELFNLSQPNEFIKEEEEDSYESQDQPSVKKQEFQLIGQKDQGKLEDLNQEGKSKNSQLLQDSSKSKQDSCSQQDVGDEDYQPKYLDKVKQEEDEIQENQSQEKDADYDYKEDQYYVDQKIISELSPSVESLEQSEPKITDKQEGIIKVKNSAVKKFKSLKQFRFIPILQQKKYFSSRLLKHLFNLLKKKTDTCLRPSKRVDPYKKQFKYLSNFQSQSKLGEMNNVGDVAKYLKSQKPFLKNQEIVKTLKQFIVQEGGETQFYLLQLEAIHF